MKKWLLFTTAAATAGVGYAVLNHGRRVNNRTWSEQLTQLGSSAANTARTVGSATWGAASLASGYASAGLDAVRSRRG